MRTIYKGQTGVPQGNLVKIIDTLRRNKISKITFTHEKYFYKFCEYNKSENVKSLNFYKNLYFNIIIFKYSCLGAILCDYKEKSFGKLEKNCAKH